MTKTIETGLVFESIGKALAERSGFKPVNMSIDLATVPQETLLRLARQGAVIFVSRMFAADKDSKIKESDYAESIATMFEAWKKGTEWRVKSASGPSKVQSNDWIGKAINKMVKQIMTARKVDLSDAVVFKAIRETALTNETIRGKIVGLALQLEAEHNAKQSLMADIDLTEFDAKPTKPTKTQDKVDF